LHTHNIHATLMTKLKKIQSSGWNL